MFTGIITHLGKLRSCNGPVLTFRTDPAFCSKITSGTSVSINGTCLTILAKPGNNSFAIELMPETSEKTMLGTLKINDLVNLELPATPKTFLSGHIVQGHIDGTSRLLDIKPSGNSKILKFSSSPALIKYIVKKGSIAINGISLTIIEANKNYFTVGIIPQTWDHTTMNTIKIGNFANIEVDILAKYLEKLTKK